MQQAACLTLLGWLLGGLVSCMALLSPMLGLVALKTLDEFLATVPEGDKRARMTDVIDWVHSDYPDLELQIKWSQPMFTLGGTYIVGFFGGVETHGHRT